MDIQTEAYLEELADTVPEVRRPRRMPSWTAPPLRFSSR